MKRLENNILLYTILIETTQSGTNKAVSENEEAYIQSEAYLLEYRRWVSQIDGLRAKLERERNLPDVMIIKQQLENMERELDQTRLQFSLWKNNYIIEATNNLKTFTQNKENLERHVPDLERNIRNATVASAVKIWQTGSGDRFNPSRLRNRQ